LGSLFLFFSKLSHPVPISVLNKTKNLIPVWFRVFEKTKTPVSVPKIRPDSGSVVTKQNQNLRL
jgi:hypothetical protein